MDHKDFDLTNNTVATDSAFDHVPFTTSEEFDNAMTHLSNSSAAFETMDVDTSMMATSSAMSNDIMHAFTSPPAGDMSMYEMNFPGFTPSPGANQWPWQHQDSNQAHSFDMRNGLASPPQDETQRSMETTQSFANGISPSEITKNKKRSSRKMSGGDMDADKFNTGRKPRKNSRAMADLDGLDDDGGEEGDEKREKFLERNRVAASKCRQKKKNWTTNLEQRARDLTNERQILATHVAMLRNELLELKCKCLEHTDCECEQIRQYLKNTISALKPAQPALYQDNSESRKSSSTSTLASSLSPTSFEPSKNSSHSSGSGDSGFEYLKLKLEDEMQDGLSGMPEAPR